jgi:glycosyltransferase involved in cell wall biosynthesis
MTGIPYIVSLRGGDVPSFVPAETSLMHRLLSPLTHLVVNRAAQLVGVSDDLSEMAKRDFPQATGKISTIRNAIELPKLFATRPEICTFVFAGRLTPQKNLAVVLRALRSVNGEYRLHILGDGPLRNELEVLAAPLGDRVTFHGWTSTNAVFNALNNAHYLLLPSLAEGISNAGLQALSRGVPIIGADSPGIRSFVEPSRTGYLFPAHDEKALSTILKDVTSHPELSKSMASACRETIAREYSLSSSADAYLNLLTSVAKGRS